MRLFYLFAIFFVLPLSADVFFVPGWRTGFDAREGSVKILKEVYPGKKIIVKSWDSLQPWDITKRNAKKQTDKLLKEILELPKDYRRELILVGHSIGAQIVVEILHELSLRDLQIHSTALLGAAIPDDDPRLKSVLRAIRYYCCIVYNPDDWVLRYLFPLDNAMHSPLGLNGWTGKDPRVFEAKTVSDRFGFCNHYAYIYLNTLNRLIKELPPEYPEIKVLQDEPNDVRIPGDELFWETVQIYDDWKLQKSVSGKFRIIDPWGKRRANGSEKAMQEAFSDIKCQLNK